MENNAELDFALVGIFWQSFNWVVNCIKQSINLDASTAIPFPISPSLLSEKFKRLLNISWQSSSAEICAQFCEACSLCLLIASSICHLYFEDQSRRKMSSKKIDISLQTNVHKWSKQRYGNKTDFFFDEWGTRFLKNLLGEKTCQIYEKWGMVCFQKCTQNKQGHTVSRENFACKMSRILALETGP